MKNQIIKIILLLFSIKAAVNNKIFKDSFKCTVKIILYSAIKEYS